MTDEKDMAAELEKYKAEYNADNAKTSKQKMDEGMLKAGLTMLGSQSKPERKAKGGTISSASKRADGCATKGKTRGKMI